MNEIERLKLQLETVKAKKMLIVKSSQFSQANQVKDEEKSIIERINDIRVREGKNS